MTSETKIPELKLRTPKDKVQPMPQYTSEGYPTGTYADGLGHAQQAVQVVLRGGESRADWEIALFRMYQNGQSAELEKNLNFVEISKIRSFIREMDERMTPLATAHSKPKMYQKPCGCESAYPPERLITDGRIRCTKHGSYEYSFKDKKFMPTKRGLLGDEPSGRTGGGMY